MKNIGDIKKISIVLISLLFILSSCETLQNTAKEITREYIEENKPEIKVKEASIASITFKDITLDVLLNIKNNFPFELPLERIDVELINSDNKVFTTASTVETLKNLLNNQKMLIWSLMLNILMYLLQHLEA